MPRRAARKGSRAAGPAATPTPIPSARNTPLPSAHPSAYNTENELEDDDFNPAKIESSLSPAKSSKSKKTISKFPFLSLPSELRIKIYAWHFAGMNRVVDLDPDNHKRTWKKLGLLRTCRQIYAEASHFFYSTNTFRLFPTHPGRFFKTKKPLLARLSSRQRNTITSVELRLGPGWNKPPRGWVVNTALGLRDCVNLKTLTVFVECDPSNDIFNGFRRADGFYEGFCRDLLDHVLAEMPWLGMVYFDAWTSVKKSGDMMRGLLDVARFQNRRVGWGPERGWTDDTDDGNGGADSGLIGHMGMSGVLVMA
jgi:hypothetical protein